MPWYKYLPNQYAVLMAERGKIRVGTLFDYRNSEKYGDQIGDDAEGTKSESSFVEQAASTEDLNRVERKAVRFAQGIKGSSLKNCMIRVSESAKDVLVYSISDSFSLSIMKRISRELKDPYDTCVKISNPEKFMEIIAESLKKEFTLLGGFKCIYEERNRFVSKRPSQYHPSIIKSPLYSYQRELRVVFEQKVEDDSQIAPVFLELPEVAEICEIIYVEKNIATDDNTIVKRIFEQEVILLDSATFKECVSKNVNCFFRAR